MYTSRGHSFAPAFEAGQVQICSETSPDAEKSACPHGPPSASHQPACPCLSPRAGCPPKTAGWHHCRWPLMHCLMSGAAAGAGAQLQRVRRALSIQHMRKGEGKSKGIERVGPAMSGNDSLVVEAHCWVRGLQVRAGDGFLSWNLAACPVTAVDLLTHGRHPSLQPSKTKP